MFLFSEKILSKNSPSSLGSNVLGTIQYTPGGNLKRHVTSRKFINAGDLATDALYLKKLMSNGLGNRSGYSNYIIIIINILSFIILLLIFLNY